MRQRLRNFRERERPMARRPIDDARVSLSPRSRRLAGWLAAILLVVGIAVVLRVLGGNGDGAPIGAAPSGSASGTAAAEIAFGTALDPVSGQVADAARTDRFVAGDIFSYSVPPDGAVPAAVYVEVRRISGATEEIVQEPIDADALPDPNVIAFRVPTEDLLAVFGPGTYLMLIYAEPTGEPIAEGTFELVSADPSAAPSP
jgi:hypothetical protein